MLESVSDALARGNTAEAIAEARRVLEANPGSIDALHGLAQALRADGQVEAARETVDDALARAPDRAELHLLSGLIAMDARDPATARAALEEGLAHNPNLLAAQVLLVQWALAEGRLDEAAERQALARRIAPEHPHVAVNESALLSARGQHDAALQQATAAAQKVPEDPLVLGALGRAYLHKGLNAFAADALHKALERTPGDRHLRWLRVEALRREDRHDEVLAEARTLADGDARDLGARALIGDTLFALGRREEALASYRDLLAAAPDQLVVVDSVLRALAARDAREDAVALLEERLAADPSQDLLWEARTDLETGNPDAASAVLQRWLSARPDAAAALERDAVMREARGDLGGAIAQADRALSAGPRSGATLVKMRAQVQLDPAAALDTLEVLEAAARRPESRRIVHAWRGLALDRLDRCEEAVASWKAMSREPLATRPLPPVRAEGPSAEPLQGVCPNLLWGPPGAPVERIVLWLREVDGLHMLDDRFGGGPRPDGLGPDLSAGPGDIGRWAGILQRAGLQPAEVVDWLPHLDPALLSAMPGNRLVAVLRDPRDLLLNWWVFGSAQQYGFPDVEDAAAYLAGVLEPVARRLASGDGSLFVVRASDLAGDAEGLTRSLADFLGVTVAPELPASVGVTAFPDGHWTRYRPAFDAAFGQLEAIASRLGY